MSNRHRYTSEQIEFLREISQGRFNDEITKLFNQKFNLTLTESAIAGIRKKYKIKSGIDAKFKPNNSPWNKGLKGICTGEREGRFKKGYRPYHCKPIGSERITEDGYIEIKVAEPKKWQSKHTFIWEKHNGKIPKGHVIIFADRNKRNFDLDNLILVSRSELARMNKKHFIKEEADLTKTGLNIVKLEQAIYQKLK